MKKILSIFSFLILLSLPVYAQDNLNATLEPKLPVEATDIQEPADIFDDAQLLDGYTVRFSQNSKETLLEMIKDDTVTGLRSAAAVRAFKEKYSQEIVSEEKRIIERILLRRLNRADSPFIKVEIMETLCLIDHYRYFGTMVPALIQKMDHYNSAINEIAYKGLKNITLNNGSQRSREARIVFNTLRNVLFLSRNRLKNIKTPDERLTQKLTLLRWSIKILGTQELKRLPKEVINLL